MKLAKESTCMEYLVCFIIRTSNKERFEDLKTDLYDGYFKGRGQYLKKTDYTLRLLQNHKSTGVLTRNHNAEWLQ